MSATPIAVVKAARIRHLTDARYFAVFAEWVGFPLIAQDPKSLSPTTARELMGWLSGVRFVGEFDHSPIEHINAYINELKIDTIEVTQHTSLIGLSPMVSSVMRRIPFDHLTDIAALDTWLADNHRATSAFVFDWTNNDPPEWIYQTAPETANYLRRWCTQYQILFQLPFEIEIMQTIIADFRPFGIELSGSDEQQIGLKTFDELNELVEQLQLIG